MTPSEAFNEFYDRFQAEPPTDPTDIDGIRKWLGFLAMGFHPHFKKTLFNDTPNDLLEAIIVVANEMGASIFARDARRILQDRERQRESTYFSDRIFDEKNQQEMRRLLQYLSLFYQEVNPQLKAGRHEIMERLPSAVKEQLQSDIEHKIAEMYEECERKNPLKKTGWDLRRRFADLIGRGSQYAMKEEHERQRDFELSLPREKQDQYFTYKQMARELDRISKEA